MAVADSVVAQHLANKQAQATPHITHMLGVPCSGKSTYIAQHQLLKPHTVFISFDHIMENLPPYETDLAAHGAQTAFENWELCARSLGYETLFQALEQGLDIVFDHGGARPDHVTLLQHAKAQLGYQINIVWLDVPNDVALQRASQRPRHLPSHYVAERQQALATLLPSYKALADNFVEAT